MNQQNFTPRNRSFSRGRNQNGNRGNYNNRNKYRPNYRNRSRGRWNNHRSGDGSNNYQNYNRQGNTRPNYRQNAQWTSGNRSQSRSRNENHNNDYTRGRSRDRHNNRSVPRRREESRSQSNSRVSTNHDQVRCYRCQEYDHFPSKFSNTPTDEEPDYEDADPASLQIMAQNYSPIDSEGGRIFKLVKGKNGLTPFLPSKEKTGGEGNYIQNKEAMGLTERQADHVYEVTEKGDMINTKTMTCETPLIQNDNPYKKVVLNKVFKEEDKSPEMRNWSIFSDNVRYIQHDQATPQNLNIDTLDYRDHKELYFKLREKKGEL